MDIIVNRPLDTYSGVATAALRAALETHGLTEQATASRASVLRSGGRLAVALDLPDATTEVCEACAVKVLGALQKFDPWISTIDVRTKNRAALVGA